MLSKKTCSSIGLDFVISKLECFSYYGNEKIRNLLSLILDELPLVEIRNGLNLEIPFGNLNLGFLKLETCFKNISLLGKLSQNHLANLQDSLARFKNIKGIIKKLESASLSEIDFFEVKVFLLALENFFDIWDKMPFVPEDILFAKMTDALDLLDENKQRAASFFIEDGGYPLLRDIRRQKMQIEALIDKDGMADELIQKRAKVAAREDVHEKEALKDLSGKLRPFANQFILNIENIAELDFLLAKSVLAKNTGASCPSLFTKNVVLKNMWNPYNQSELSKHGKKFTKISIELEPGATVITGANMGGKSIAIKSAVLNVALANLGFFVFAEEAEMPVFDDICFIEENTGDNFVSSFGAEILQINQVISKLDKEKLFIAIDEPARATNPAEGAKITKGLVSYFTKQNSVAIISTHYDNVHQNANAHYQTAGINFSKLDDINYELRKAAKDAKVPAEAINLCRILGLNTSLLAEIERL